MLRAGVNDKDNPLIVCGLSDGNLTRLRNGQPIKAVLRSIGVDLPGQLVVFHGPTEADMEATFREYGLIGDDTRANADPRVDQEAAVRRDHAHILLLTIGLPRSGKSTWARSQGYPVINPDAIRLALHGQRFAAEAEPFVWASAKLMVRALFLAGHKTVILDATNTTKKRREEWLSPDWAVYYKVFATPADVCRARAEALGDTEILPVIDRMAAAAEPLGPDDRLWP